MMDRRDKDEDIRQRQERYQRGLVALTTAINGFRELTGIDLLDTVDIGGRHMGEAPYLKLTAERLAEVTAEIEGEVAQASANLAELSGLIEAADAPIVLQFERPVLTARRPGLVRP